MPRYINLVGQKFGRLTVIDEASDSRHEKNRHVKWLCECECGNLVSVQSNSLHNGTTLSCGCYHSDRVIETHTKHGLCYDRINRIYKAMHQRCENPKAFRYDRYGGRGIKVCDEWSGEKGFENFYAWSSQNGYSEDLSIDRIDNNKGYSPNNCRWVDHETQDNNKSTNHYVTYNGETKTLSQWGRAMGLKKSTIQGRLHRGWNEIDAITIPVGVRKGGYRKKC